MNRKLFNPKEWLEQPTQQTININTEPQKVIPANQTSEVEKIIQQIENKQIDITSAYSDWCSIGFAFANEFGEDGRDYFHRISHFYPNYSVGECNHQFDNCLKAKGKGVSLKSFFYYVKQAGISIASQRKEQEQEVEILPTFPDSLYAQLPDFLKRIVKIGTSNEEKDIMLLGSLVTLSACLPKVYGLYDGNRVYANLYLFVTAQASAGKGRLTHCKQLVKPIHMAMREQASIIKQQYESDSADYNTRKARGEPVDKPQKPQEKMLFIPANNSTTGVFQLLSDNEGKGLIFETEGDTLSQAFKSDYGNYSDGFRKAFHHETISYYRRTDHEYVDIDSPRLSAVLTGTPNQIPSLIPNAENGLFSRFIFYFMKVHLVWKNVFSASTAENLDDYFKNLGGEFLGYYNSLLELGEIQFSFNADQQAQFNKFFAETQNIYISVKGLDYLATVRRLGLNAFRLSMVFSVLRKFETGELPESIICEEQDFQSVLIMIRVLVKHSAKVFSELPEETKPLKRKNRKEKFLEHLPLNFNRQKYLNIAQSLSVPNKTAEGYITQFVKKGLIHRESQDNYINVFNQEKNTS